MTDHGSDRGRINPRRARSEESLLRGGLRGISLVTLATVALAVVGAAIALVVSWFY